LFSDIHRKGINARYGQNERLFKLPSAGTYLSASDMFNSQLIYVVIHLSLHLGEQKSSTVRDIKADFFFRLQANAGTASFNIIMLQPLY